MVDETQGRATRSKIAAEGVQPSGARDDLSIHAQYGKQESAGKTFIKSLHFQISRYRIRRKACRFESYIDAHITLDPSQSLLGRLRRPKIATPGGSHSNRLWSIGNAEKSVSKRLGGPQADSLRASTVRIKLTSLGIFSYLLFLGDEAEPGLASSSCIWSEPKRIGIALS